jgi:ribonuclease-3
VILDEKGPDHAKCFEVCVELGPRRFESCWGASKKQAEQQAAMKALLELGLAEEMDGGEVRIIRDNGAE